MSSVNAALQDVAKRNNMTLAQLPEALAKQGVDYATYREEIRREITLQLLRQRDVLQRISVTPREIDQFLEKQAKTPSERNEYNVSHILIAVGQEATPGAAGCGRASAPRTSTSAPRAARTSPSSRSPIPTARPPRWRCARLAQGQRAADLPRRRHRQAQARRGERAAAHAHRLPHHQAQRGARRRRQAGRREPGARAPHPHEDQRARRRRDGASRS